MWIAYNANSSRSDTPNLSKMLCRWFFHRLLTDKHLFGHLFVLIALRHQSYNLTFALAQGRPLAVLFCPPPVFEAISSGDENCRMTAAVVWESSQISPEFTLRMLLTIRSGAVCFRTMPEQPSFIACTNSFLSSEAVSTITRVLRLDCCKACSAERPSRFGIRRSSSRTSGSKFLNAFQYFPAVAGFTDNFEIVFQREQLLQAIAHDWMVVSNDHPNVLLALFRQLLDSQYSWMAANVFSMHRS